MYELVKQTKVSNTGRTYDLYALYSNDLLVDKCYINYGIGFGKSQILPKFIYRLYDLGLNKNQVISLFKKGSCND